MKVAIITGTRYEMKPGAAAVSHLRRALAWADLAILGDCPTGVDAAAKAMCVDSSVAFEVLCADWDKYGGRAGPIRNGEMVFRATGLIEDRGASVRCFAFPSKSSRGTWDCLRQAATAGIRGHVCPVE